MVSWLCTALVALLLWTAQGVINRLERVEANQLRIMLKLNIEPIAGLYGAEYQGPDLSMETNMGLALKKTTKK